MRIKALVMVAAAGLLLAADAKEDAAKEMKKLEGTWKVVSAEAGGAKIPDDKLKDAFIVIKGDKLTMVDKGKDKDNKELTLKIDPSKKPKLLDLTDPKEKDGKPVPAIYALDGNELKICIPLVEMGKKADAKRPESFETKDKAIMTFNCKREKS